jgi:vacuolar fusion protein MON1
MADYISTGYTRKHQIQDIQSQEWIRHKKHFFIISSSGKPVYSRYGDELMLAPMMGLIQAFLAFFEEEKDPLRYIKVRVFNVGP